MKTLVDRENLIFSPPQLGCVLYLPGLPGGGSKIQDRSPYGNQGTITGATWKRLPSGLWYLDFDGQDDYVNCGSVSSLNPSTAMTLKAWIKPISVASDHLDIICRDATNQRAFVFQTVQTSAYLSIAVSKTAAGSWTTLTSTDAVALGAWNQVGAIYQYVSDGASLLELFLNGVSIKSVSNAVGPIASTTSETRIGIRQVLTEWFYGGMALIEMHNKAWTALDFQNSFNREKHLFGVW